MKQVKTFTGGHPITVNDIEHMQDGLTEAIIALVKALATDGAAIPNCVLFGFNITASGGGFTTYAPGAAVINGEICQFDGATVASGLTLPNHYVIRTSDTYVAGNPITYGDGSTKNVHLIRKVIIASSAVATTSNEIDLDHFTLLKDVLKANLFSFTNAWVRVGSGGGAPAYNSTFLGYGLTTAEELRFCKLLSGMVIIEGGLEFNGVSTVGSLGSINYTTPLRIFTLPVGYRPDTGSAYMEVSVETPDGWASFTVKVYDNGNVSLVKVYNIGAGVTPASFNGTLSIARLSIMFKAV